MKVSPSPSETLCLSCGMCCSGSLHNWTKLQPHEKVPAQQSGLTVFTRRDGTPAFRQPCAAFEDPVCTIYTRRPEACRSYVCPLLKRLMDGEISLDEALGYTRQVRRLIASLQSKMPASMPGVPLEWQVRLSWHPNAALPPDVQPIFEELAGLLKTVWLIKWKRRKNSAAKKAKRH